jgi:hypothetical protein
MVQPELLPYQYQPIVEVVIESAPHPLLSSLQPLSSPASNPLLGLTIQTQWQLAQ